MDELPQTHTHHNLSPSELKALKDLTRNKHLTIKMADKGAKIVVQDTTEYSQSGCEHLRDTEIYEQLSEDPTKIMNEDIQQYITSLFEEGQIDQTTYNFLRRDSPPPRTQRIYFLKKLHKTPIAVRPIVSGINGLTEKVSEFLDYFLQPIVTHIPSYLKNTRDLLTELENIPITNHTILCTVDVKSLYLCIPQEEGTEACLSHLEREDKLPLPRDTLKHLFDFVLKYNTFKFGGNCYKQVRGTAMGTKMAPAYAGIFMSSLEEPFLATQPLKPLLFRRYIDDILIVWEHGHQQLTTFLTALNALHETIKFTWEISEDSVTFLDVDIYKQREEDNTTLSYRTHFKASNSFQYVHHTSYHPKATKQGIIKGELTRISNTTSPELATRCQTQKSGTRPSTS